jgi:hypothetical protein
MVKDLALYHFAWISCESCDSEAGISVGAGESMEGSRSRLRSTVSYRGQYYVYYVVVSNAILGGVERRNKRCGD